jgi:two-component system, OmpR family, sensor histidine kinase KdpD
VRTRALRQTARIVGGLSVIAVLTVIFHRLLPVNAATTAVVYLLAVLLIAAEWGLAEAVVASFGAMLCFNFFFLPPVGTLTIADPENWVAIVAFLLTSIIASQLSAKARRRAEEAQSRRQEVERLYELSRALLLAENGQPLAAEIARLVIRIFECDSVAFFDRQLGQVFRAGDSNTTASDDELRDSARQGSVFHDPSGRTTTMPVRLGGQPAGSISVPDGAISEAALRAIVSLSAIALEREKAQAGVAAAEAQRRNEELKSTLLDAVAHEFKTPLTSIKAAATAMLSAAPSPQDRELLTIIDEETVRLDEMVSEAIQMSRIEAGKVQLNRRPVDLCEMVETVVKASASFLEDRSIEVRVPSGLPAAYADRELVMLVLRQLLNNAAKYSSPGMPIVVEAAARDGSLVISVTDAGPGIPEAEQALIFEKFYRARGVRGRVPGTGMGLPIARQIVHAHKGRLWAESYPEMGTRFSFSLPPVPTEQKTA